MERLTVVGLLLLCWAALAAAAPRPANQQLIIIVPSSKPWSQNTINVAPQTSSSRAGTSLYPTLLKDILDLYRRSLGQLGGSPTAMTGGGGASATARGGGSWPSGSGGGQGTWTMTGGGQGTWTMTGGSSRGPCPASSGNGGHTFTSGRMWPRETGLKTAAEGAGKDWTQTGNQRGCNILSGGRNCNGRQGQPDVQRPQWPAQEPEEEPTEPPQLPAEPEPAELPEESTPMQPDEPQGSGVPPEFWSEPTEPRQLPAEPEPTEWPEEPTDFRDYPMQPDEPQDSGVPPEEWSEPTEPRQLPAEPEPAEWPEEPTDFRDYPMQPDEPQDSGVSPEESSEPPVVPETTLAVLNPPEKTDCPEGAVFLNRECVCRDPTPYLDTILERCVDSRPAIY